MDHVADPPTCTSSSASHHSAGPQAPDKRSHLRRTQVQPTRAALTPPLSDPRFLVSIQLRAHITAVHAMRANPSLLASSISDLDLFLSKISVPFTADDVDPDDPLAVIKFAESVTF
jgi:hypothetical protein